MIRAWRSPDGAPFTLGAGLEEKVASLSAAAERGARFLVLPTANNEEAAAWILATFHAPLAVVPLPPGLPEEALAKRLEQLPKGSVRFIEDLPPPKVSATSLKRKSPDQTWLVIFTSGSSGEAKGVALSGAALEASARAQASHSSSTNLTWLLNLPLHHISGFSVLSRAFFLQSALAIAQSRFDAAETARWIHSGIVQGLSLVPTTLFRLLQEKVDLSLPKLMLLGGAPASPELLEAARARNANIRLTYGMSEHASQIATEKQSGGGMELLPGVEAQRSEEGELLIRSPMLCSGFYQKGQLVPLPLQNSLFPTGDLGAVLERRITIEGRKSDLIICGGAKVFPAEVEQALGRVASVKDCAVGSIPNAEWGELLCAAVVEEKPGAFCESEAKATLSKVMESRKIPKKWVVVSAVPRSEAGKLKRAEIHKLFLNLSR